MIEAIISNKDDKKVLLIASLLFNMYNEVDINNSSKNIEDYKNLALSHIDKDFVFLYSNKALFIMRDVTSPVINKKLWDGVSVYIKPEYRNTKILSKLYKYMFANFEGTIIGFVNAGSNHEEIVKKRNKKLGCIYELNRY